MSEIFNIASPDVRPNPYPVYEELRRLGPVVENPLFGVWMILGHQECERVLLDPQTFSNVVEGDPTTAFFRKRTMLASDPPDHERLRKVVAAAFTPRSLQALEGRVTKVAAELVAELGRAPGPVDLVAGLSAPLPMIVIAELLGVPPEDRLKFKEWSQGIAGVTQLALADDETREKGRLAAEAMQGYLADVIAERRRKPGDDLVSRMVEANGGGILTDEELVASSVLLLVAGNETTTNLITNAVLALARHPEERRRLLADPSLIRGAIEEILRFDPPVHSTIRTATHDAVVAGQTIPAGMRILVLVAAANRDSRVFAEPDRLDLTRSNARDHLGFGAGIHFCIGAILARLEGRLALEALLRAAPDYAIADDGASITYGPSFILRGITSLPIVMKP